MEFSYDDNIYNIVIEKKISNRNTYIRVDKDLNIKVTTNKFVSDRDIKKLIDTKYKSIVKMIEAEKVKQKNNEGFYFLGTRYDIIYTTLCDIRIDYNEVYLNKNFDLDKWYKNQAKDIFRRHLDKIYNSFSRTIPKPNLKIRKMTTRWGVCNIRLKTITLNLELIKRDPKYLDYVIVHELSHLIYPDHSKLFWSLVEENISDYKKYRKEMKEF